jgi:hypothetical protein
MSRPEYLHAVLLRIAMAERNEEPGALWPDHMEGTTRTEDGRTFGIVYPDSFFARSAALMDTPKDRRFVFRGKMYPGRAVILDEFRARWPEALIEATDAGRDADGKGEWDAEYWGQLARAEFGLCPHQPDFMHGRHKPSPGKPQYDFPLATLWTYRFIECCMVGAIPVQFRATPLCEPFTEGIEFVWDDAEEFVYDRAAALRNREVAEQRWRLPE